MKAVAAKAQDFKDAFLRAVDDDSMAFDEVMSAMKLPKKTDDEIRRRQDAIETATKKAVEVPLSVVGWCADAVDLVDAVAKKGNRNSISDAGVAALALRAAAAGAALNVLINLPGLADKSYAGKTRRKTADLSARVGTRCSEIYEYVLGRLEKGFD